VKLSGFFGGRVSALAAASIVLYGFGCGGRSERDDGASGNADDGVGGSSSGGSDSVDSTGGVATSGKGGSSAGGTRSSTGGRTCTSDRAGSAGFGWSECQDTADCQLVGDCCGCRAESDLSEAGESDCSASCEVDACTAAGIESDEVECLLGQCVINRSCDRNRVTCPDTPPVCPSGTVPSVGADDCWGPCIAPNDCAWVTDCSDCGDALCVGFTPGDTFFACHKPTRYCDCGNYCNCLLSCPYDCFERNDMVSCVCLECT
jgi:hypothetical protein